MKLIKEYITEGLFEQRQTIYEGLFDDEDDLLDNKLSAESIEWFDEHVKFVKSLGHNIIPAEKVLSVNDGALTLKLPIATDIEFYEQPPKWIKFDKKSWEDAFSKICYDVTSQKDIERIPQGRNGHIIKFLNHKTQNIVLDDWCAFESKNLKNIIINKGCNIEIVTDDIDQLTEIKFSKFSNQNYLSLINCDLAKKLFEEYKRLKTKCFVNKYRDILVEMYKYKSVYAFNLNNKKTFYLDYVL